MTDTLGKRVFAIRAALGDGRIPLSQDAFATLLTERGKKAYYGPDFSVLERDMKKTPLSIEDIEVIASVDPERRGKYWLAWGELPDETMAQSQGPTIIKEPSDAVFENRAPTARGKGRGEQQGEG